MIIITIILSFGVGISKNKSIDHRVKEAWDYISVLCHSTMSSALNFLFLFILMRSKRKISYQKKYKLQKREKFVCEISIIIIIIILICHKLASVGPYNKKLSCLCLKHIWQKMPPRKKVKLNESPVINLIWVNDEHER